MWCRVLLERGCRRARARALAVGEMMIGRNDKVNQKSLAPSPLYWGIYISTAPPNLLIHHVFVRISLPLRISIVTLALRLGLIRLIQERMVQRFGSCDPARRVPVQALTHQVDRLVDEQVVFCWWDGAVECLRLGR